MTLPGLEPELLYPEPSEVIATPFYFVKRIGPDSLLASKMVVYHYKQREKYARNLSHFTLTNEM